MVESEGAEKKIWMLEKVMPSMLLFVLFLLLLVALFTIYIFILDLWGSFSGIVSIEVLISDVMLFLLVVELIRVVEVYIQESHFYLQAVVAAALIGVCRHIIVLTELKEASASAILANAVLVLSLGATFYIISVKAKGKINI